MELKRELVVAVATIGCFLCWKVTGFQGIYKWSASPYHFPTTGSTTISTIASRIEVRAFEPNDTSCIVSTMNENKSKACVQNVRPAAGLPEGIVYRCASTDTLGQKLKQYDIENPSLKDEFQDLADNVFCDTDKMILYEAGLILDLRSPIERNDTLASYWMNHPMVTATGSSFQVLEDESILTMDETAIQSTLSSITRYVVRYDVLNPKRFMKYVDENWLSSASQKAQLTWYKLMDGQKLHELRMDALNDRGLAGLNEAILEIGKDKLCHGLKLITMYIETISAEQDTRQQNDVPDVRKIYIHCVQGKDRTGMLVMLLQSILSVSDDLIIEDYYQSNKAFPSKTKQSSSSASAAAATIASRKEKRISSKGKLDRRIFSGTNRQAMITTLSFLRNKYGSISPGYLDDIGFGENWRARLITKYQITSGPKKDGVSLRLQSCL